MDITKDSIRWNLVLEERWLKRGIVAIYRGQTSQEMGSRMSIHHNGVGFDTNDAKSLSGLAVRILNGVDIPPKELNLARVKMVKYAGQLLKIAKAKQKV